MEKLIAEGTWTQQDLSTLAGAVRRLECPGLAMKLAMLIGDPIANTLKRLPEKATEVVHTATQKAIERCLEVALKTMESGQGRKPANVLHKVAAGVAGAAGGAGGLATLVAELPLSTGLMLRSIADVAQSLGEDLSQPESQLECIAVFALSKSKDDELGYYAVRAALASAIPEAAASLFETTAARRSAPGLVRFVTQVASRFGITVSEKVAAQAVPVIGAVSGAAINVAFTDAYQELATGHFTVRSLERKYGAEPVRREYERIKASLRC